MSDKQIVNGYYFPSKTGALWLENVIKEIWDDHEYDRYGVRINQGDIVLDFGANVGSFSKYAINQGARHVYAFECENDEFEYLELNTKDEPKITITKGFVSDRNDENHYNLPKIFNSFDLGMVDFCKIDIENWEYPLLFNANPDDLKLINQFAIEVHNIYNNYQNILEMFSKIGFSTNYEQVHKNCNLGMIYAKNKNIL